ncbi:MAG: carbohydrate ABC transporter permease [Nitrospinaceae bacterium]
MRRALDGLFLLAAAAWSLGPFIWQWLTSVKSPGRVTGIPPLLPDAVHWDHYLAVLSQESFLRVILNTFTVSLGAVTLSLAVGVPGAFGVSRLLGRSRNGVLLALLVVFMIPQIAVVTPFYKMLTALHLKDSLVGLIVTYSVFTVPLVVWITCHAFEEIPDSLFRAAQVDGCGLWRIFWKVYVPLGRPGWISAGLLTLIYCWNEFMFALTFTTTYEARTIPVGIALFAGQYSFPWGEISAASSLVTLPLLAAVMVAQKSLVRGLTAGGQKG